MPKSGRLGNRRPGRGRNLQAAGSGRWGRDRADLRQQADHVGAHAIAHDAAFAQANDADAGNLDLASARRNWTELALMRPGHGPSPGCAFAFVEKIVDRETEIGECGAEFRGAAYPLLAGAGRSAWKVED
jgi:hypothetical protein